MSPIATTQLACVLHHHHAPAPTYQELHHVIPQAWQAHWQPPKPWPNAGRSPDRPGLELWDARTVAICRTGHGNVHFWLVKIMREVTATPDLGQAEHDVKAHARATGLIASVQDFAQAVEAMTRWIDAGGTLDDLAAHHLWGEI